MPLSRITSASIANSAISAADIADGTITAAKIISVANTQITGNIVSSQIAPSIVLNTPALGTPASGVLTNCTGVPAAALPAGSVLQVVSSTKSDTFSSATLGWLDVTGLSVSITPRSTSSKIMVFGRITGEGSIGATRMQMRLVRDTTSISIGDAASARIQVSGNEIYGGADADSLLGSTVFYLDSPATTSASTYKIQVLNGNGNSTIYINRTQNDTNSVVTPRATSSITVMEIQG